jgi:hypothetical protein
MLPRNPNPRLTAQAREGNALHFPGSSGVDLAQHLAVLTGVGGLETDDS